MEMKVFTASVFAVVSLFCLFYTESRHALGRYVFKMLLMPVLLAFYLVYASEPRIYVIAALICGFVGDTFLLWSSKKGFFLAGIAAFLAGHLFYIAALLFGTMPFFWLPWTYYVFAIPYLAYGILIYISLYRNLGVMKLPAAVYIIVILVMSYLSLTRMESFSGTAFWLPLTGSFFFIASDTLLAFHHFSGRIRFGGILIMSTYIIAQVMLVLGL